VNLGAGFLDWARRWAGVPAHGTVPLMSLSETVVPTIVVGNDEPSGSALNATCRRTDLGDDVGATLRWMHEPLRTFFVERLTIKNEALSNGLMLLSVVSRGQLNGAVTPAGTRTTWLRESDRALLWRAVTDGGFIAQAIPLPQAIPVVGDFMEISFGSPGLRIDGEEELYVGINSASATTCEVTAWVRVPGALTLKS
jgi:hypothetical protein